MQDFEVFKMFQFFCLEACESKNLVKFMSFQSLEILKDENFKL
jgi:hypothetical protein